MSVPPVTLGNVDPGLAAIPRVNRPQPLVLVEVEQYPNPAPRKCIGFMLLISSLLVLRVQQDRYAEVVPYHGAKPDDRKFPWELQTLVSANSSFDATFLALPPPPGPIRSASTFLRSQTDPAVLITGAGSVASANGGEREASGGGEALDGLTALVTGRVSKLPAACSSSSGGPCYVGVQRDPPAPRLRGNSSCFRFLAGASSSSLRPLAERGGSQPGRFCLGSTRVRLRAAAAGTNGTVAVSWDIASSRPGVGHLGKALTCIAVLGFPGMHAGPVNAVGWASTVLFDEATSSVITIGFLSEHRLGDVLAPMGRPLLTVSAFDAATLRPRMRYRLPLSTAWLLRSPHVSDGFLLFIGSEQPFIGASFVIDLRSAQVFAQDPPPAPGLPGRRRQRLPSKLFVEPPAAGGGWADGTGPPSPRGPCADLVHGRKTSP
uniref:Uncharacterized protein n=1 Tax=Alexandrium catenella TaxID=2925 RepID=A0A7S1WRR4_ALECA|mmetsp:Transcript_84170/g.223498  ORF Transcript_84170/g.223498 Transcript_84170/m.223498 type:complete len:433 (+) Transcript_84170:107-1405(+)